MTPEPNNQFNSGIPGKEKPKTEEQTAPEQEEPKTEDYPVFKGCVNGIKPTNKKLTGLIKATCGRCHYGFEQMLHDELLICPKCQNKGVK